MTPIKCSTCLAFYLFSSTRLINSIKHERLCKILYICNKGSTHLRSSVYSTREKSVVISHSQLPRRTFQLICWVYLTYLWVSCTCIWSILEVQTLAAQHRTDAFVINKKPRWMGVGYKRRVFYIPNVNELYSLSDTCPIFSRLCNSNSSRNIFIQTHINPHVCTELLFYPVHGILFIKKNLRFAIAFHDEMIQ